MNTKIILKNEPHFPPSWKNRFWNGIPLHWYRQPATRAHQVRGFFAKRTQTAIWWKIQMHKPIYWPSFWSRKHNQLL